MKRTAIVASIAAVLGGWVAAVAYALGKATVGR